MTNDFRNYGDFTLEQLSLTSNETSYDLYHVYAEVSISESIFAPCITGYVEVVDGNAMFDSLPIVGGEELTVKWKTKGSDKTVGDTFVIYKMSPVHKMSESGVSYKLHFISRAGYDNLMTKISRHFSGNVSDVVTDILGDINVTKILIGNISYNVDFIIPNWTPFQAINWLSMRALDTDNKTNSVLFYENLDGFNVKAVTQLYKEEPTFKFTSNHLIISDSEDYEEHLEKVFVNVSDYDAGVRFDHLTNLGDGSYGSTFYEHNMLNKTYVKQSMSLSKQTYLLGNTVYPNTTDNVTDAHIQFKTATEKNKDVQRRHMFMNSLNMNAINLYVSGNSFVRCGDMVEFDLPLHSVKDDVKQVDEKLSGTRLVSTIRHIITQSAYTTILETIKDGYSKL